jgi:drug/metabolite transporter (DMT)-like permease
MRYEVETDAGTEISVQDAIFRRQQMLQAPPECCGGWFSQEPLTFSSMFQTWRETISTTPRSTLALIGVSVFVLEATQVGMMFGMNFMIYNTTKGTNGYVSNILPAVCWAVLNAVPCIAYHVWRGWRPSYLLPRKGRWPHAQYDLLGTGILIGFFDSLGGITATYAAPHIPVFVQVLLQAFGVLWTFLLSRLVVPATPTAPKPQLSYLSVAAFVLVVVGNVVAAIPNRDSIDQSSNAAWVFIYFLAGVFPICTNVCQGRFLRTVDRCTTNANGVGPRQPIGLALVPTQSQLFRSDRGSVVSQDGIGAADSSWINSTPFKRHEHGYPDPYSPPSNRVSDAVVAVTGGSLAHARSIPAHTASTTFCCSHDSTQALVQGDMISTKLVLLTIDTVVQVVCIVIMFPLDFTPWFGDSPGDPGASWQGLIEATRCVLWECDNTIYYFLVYTLGFWLNHMAFAVLNYVSTTATAFAAGVSFPLQLLFLWWFPSLDVWGSATPWYYAVACFVTMTLSSVLFFLSEQAQRQAATRRLGAGTVLPPTAEQGGRERRPLLADD